MVVTVVDVINVVVTGAVKVPTQSSLQLKIICIWPHRNVDTLVSVGCW